MNLPVMMFTIEIDSESPIASGFQILNLATPNIEGFFDIECSTFKFDRDNVSFDIQFDKKPSISKTLRYLR